MLVSKELYYTLNYKPFLGLKKDIKNSNLIYCKNFFLFFLIIDNLLSSTNKKNYKLKIHKSKKFSSSFLRAPNKYKKAQVKITLVRYHVAFKCTKYYELPNFNFNYGFLFNFISFLFNFISFFESTLFVLKKKKLSIKLDPIKSKSLFEL